MCLSCLPCNQCPSLKIIATSSPVSISFNCSSKKREWSNFPLTIPEVFPGEFLVSSKVAFQMYILYVVFYIILTIFNQTTIRKYFCICCKLAYTRIYTCIYLYIINLLLVYFTSHTRQRHKKMK